MADDAPAPDDPVAAVLDAWRADADALRRCGHDADADLLLRRADAIEDALRRRRAELVTIARAAEVSGYSPKHLRRLVRDGRLRAERPSGDGGRILVALGDLPRKATPAKAGDDPVDRHVQKVDGGR